VCGGAPSLFMATKYSIHIVAKSPSFIPFHPNERLLGHA
jgi:hypothetical protein